MKQQVDGETMIEKLFVEKFRSNLNMKTISKASVGAPFEAGSLRIALFVSALK